MSLSVPDSSHGGAASAAADFPAPSTGSPEEFLALVQSAGVYDLGHRCFLRCTGEDRARWLNGMVTNSVAGLAASQGCYAFVLNAQGRIQGDLNIFQRGDALWLQTDRAQVETLVAFLDRYIIMDDVVLERSDWTAIGIAGPDAAGRLEDAGFPVTQFTPVQLKEVSWRGRAAIVVAAFSPLVPRYEVWCPPQDASEISNALVLAGATPCRAEAVEQLRIAEGTPRYSIDITDRDLPQETSQMRALHFSKGCYLGQEIVERIHSRGNVHRTFSGFLLDADFVLPSPGVKIPLLADDKPVGELSSMARIEIPGITKRILALGSVRREALERKTPITAAGQPVTPAALPFDFIPSAVQP